MKSICVAPLIAVMAALGCASDEAKLSPTQEANLKASFHSKPDINTLNPQMRKMVDGMIAAQKKAPTAPPPIKP